MIIIAALGNLLSSPQSVYLKPAKRDTTKCRRTDENFCASDFPMKLCICYKAGAIAGQIQKHFKGHFSLMPWASILGPAETLETLLYLPTCTQTALHTTCMPSRNSGHPSTSLTNILAIFDSSSELGGPNFLNRRTE